MQPTQNRVRFTIGACSLGYVLVAQTDAGLVAILLGDSAEDLAADLQGRFPDSEIGEDAAGLAPALEQVRRLINEPGAEIDVPLAPQGTPFQLQVWEALRQIPSGKTSTYSRIAYALGLAPGSVRAVGTACGANPLAVAIPCHRVLKADGSLAGYRWGIERKRALLQREYRATLTEA